MDVFFKSLIEGKEIKEYKPFIEDMNLLSDSITKIIQTECKIDLFVIEKLLNNIHLIMQRHLFTFHTTHGHLKTETHSIVLSAIYKNFYIFYSAVELLKKGLYGSSRVLLRQSFEFLIIGKFCALTNNDKVFKNWQEGKTVYFGKEILKNINKPDTDEIKNFWIFLCKFAHSTNVSQQVGINWEDDKNEIKFTFGLIQILLECHYHLLNSILLPNSIKSFVAYYDDNVIKKCKSEINEIFKINRINYSKVSKKLIRDFKSKWEMNP